MKTYIQQHFPEYQAWQRIHDRCYNPNCLDYINYGGANPPITCKFDTFEQFFAEIGPRPSPKHSIDRYPSQGGNYEPGNVRWATKKEQARNRNNNRLLTYNGVSRLAIELAEEHNISAFVVRARIRNGWTVERALTEPVDVNKIHPNSRHGACSTPEYHTWTRIRYKCNNPKSKEYPRYGGANPPVKVDPRWDNFEQFLKDMGPRPSPNHSIDRYPDNAGNYGPNNCRWATATEQSRNQKSNHLLTLDGVTKTITEWARDCNITRAGMLSRLKTWDLRKALTTVRI